MGIRTISDSISLRGKLITLVCALLVLLGGSLAFIYVSLRTIESALDRHDSAELTESSADETILRFHVLRSSLFDMV